MPFSVCSHPQEQNVLSNVNSRRVGFLFDARAPELCLYSSHATHRSNVFVCDVERVPYWFCISLLTRLQYFASDGAVFWRMHRMVRRIEFESTNRFYWHNRFCSASTINSYINHIMIYFLISHQRQFRAHSKCSLCVCVRACVIRTHFMWLRRGAKDIPFIWTGTTRHGTDNVECVFAWAAHKISRVLQMP